MFRRYLLLVFISIATFPLLAFGQDDAPHRVGVRVRDGAGEFYDTVTDAGFVPRGVNYIYFVDLGGGRYENRVFATNIYDSDRVREDFLSLGQRGYNTVRIFVDSCSDGANCITSTTRQGLNPEYLDNVADVTRIAAETGIYLILTSNDIPDGGGYGALANRDSNSQMAGYRNTHFLAPSGLEAATNYWNAILTALTERETVWAAVLGWSLLNEQWIFRDQPPYVLNSGTIRNNTGQEYDLSDPDQKRQMVSDAVTNYIAALVDTIHQYDPDTLVTMGFFAPAFPNPTMIGAGWYVDTASLLGSAPLDFFDFHAYTGGDLTIEQLAENFGMIEHPEIPIIMGETGSFKHTTLSAASALSLELEWMARSCAIGFDGWLHWGYYPTPPAIDDATWTLLDADALLLDGLSPQLQPDPCVEPE